MPTNDPFAIESPVYMVEGASYKYKLRIPHAQSISGPTCAMYNNQEDTSVTNLDGAATTNSVDEITSPTVKNLKGGEKYTLVFSATVDDKPTDKYLIEIRCLYPWGAM